MFLAEEIREKGSSEDKKNENYLQAVGIKYFSDVIRRRFNKHVYI